MSSKDATPRKQLTQTQASLPVPVGGAGKSKAPLSGPSGKKGGKAQPVMAPSAPIQQHLYHQNKTDKAGLLFGVPRMHKFMKEGRYSERVGAGAPISLAAIFQYITSEIIELASAETSLQKKQRITPRFVMLAIRNDVELNKLLGKGASFPDAGVPVNVRKDLTGGKKKGKGKGKDFDEDMQDDTQ